MRSFTYAHDILTRNWYQKLVPDSGTSFLVPVSGQYVMGIRRYYFQSRDKVDSHTVRSSVAENPVLHANFTVLSSVEPEFLPIEVLHYGNGELFALFCSSDLDLDLMTFIYELDPHPLKCTCRP